MTTLLEIYYFQHPTSAVVGVLATIIVFVLVFVVSRYDEPRQSTVDRALACLLISAFVGSTWPMWLLIVAAVAALYGMYAGAVRLRKFIAARRVDPIPPARLRRTK